MKSLPAQASPAPVPIGRRAGAWLDFLALTKPRLNLLVVATSAGGYYLGARGLISWLTMINTVASIALVAAGAAVLNQVVERDTDSLMRRTRLRPLPDGRVTPQEARVFGSVLAATGLLMLTLVQPLAAFLALATLVVYLVLYTPLKRRSPLATLVGAVPGALPPLVGWVAGHGSASLGGWVLFAIVFLWQVPHFMAIAWMYRDDYRQAGFPMLPVIEPDGFRAGRQALWFALGLVPASVLPAFVGVSGRRYLWTALALGVVIVSLAGRFAASRSDRSARALFYGSIVYLPVIWAAMVLDLP